MRKRKLRSVQKLPRKQGKEFPRPKAPFSLYSPVPTCSVDRITGYRVPNMQEMDPYLVGSAAFEFDPKQLRRQQPFAYLDPRRRGLTALGDRHALSVARMAPDGCLDADSRSREMTPGYRRIDAPHAPRSEALAQRLVGSVRLGHDKKPRRVSIETVDDPWA